MIAINNRKRREEIHNWTPIEITKDEQSHFFMFNENTTYQDELLTQIGSNNTDISIIKDLSDWHKDSTKLIN